MLAREDILDILSINLIGIVPEDDGVIKSSNRGEPLTFGLNSPAAQAYANIAERLQGRDIPLMELDVGASWRFLAPIKRFFGLS